MPNFVKTTYSMLNDICKLMTIWRDTPTDHYTMYSEDKGLIPMANVQSRERCRRHIWSQHDTQRRHQLPCNQGQQHNGDHKENIHLPWYRIIQIAIQITSKTRFGIWSSNLEPATDAGYHRPRERPEACHQTNSGPQRNELPGTIAENTPIPTLQYRRLRGDMIEAYKLLHNVYDPTLPSLLSPAKDSTTRDHELKLPKPENRARTNIEAHSFTLRIVSDRNNLQDEVISAPSINAFKNRLDTHWKNHPWLYDWEVTLDHSSSRSNVRIHSSKETKRSQR